MPPPNDEMLRLIDEYLHGLLDDDTAAEVERLCRTSPEYKTALEEAERRLRSLQTEPPTEVSEQLIRATVDRIDRTVKTQRLLTRRIMTGVVGTIAAGVLILTGLHIYYATLSASPIDLVVLGQRDLLAGTKSSLRIRLIDTPTRQPLGNTPVAVELKDLESGKTVELASLNTDAQGGAEPRFDLPDWKEGEYSLVITAQTSRGREVINQGVNLKRSWQVMLSSDKPVYQPGQVIHLRSLALRRPDLKPVGEQSVVFSITDPKNNVIFKQSGDTSPFGIASGDCELASELIEGPYTITCQVGDTRSQLPVQVFKYVLPKFKVEVKLDRPFYQPGETAQCTVQADYFFGKPVVNAQVEVTAQAAGQKWAVLKGRTNDQGTVVLTHKIADNLLLREPEAGAADIVPEGGAPGIPPPRLPPGRALRPAVSIASTEARLSFQALVTDPAEQKQTGKSDRVVTTVPVRISVFPEAGTLVEGVANRVYLLVTRADGSPVKAQLRIRGIRDEIKTDDTGTAVLEYTPKAQSIHWNIRALDQEGEKLAEKRLVLTCGDAGDDFLVRTDRAVYRGGESVQLTALGAGSEPVFVDFIQDGRERVSLLSTTVGVTDGKGEMTLDLPPDVSGTLELCAYRITRAGTMLRKSRILYVQPASDLKIKAHLDQDEYRPGGKAKLNFRLTDSKDQPVAGAISLAGVDRAVFSVLSQAPGSEKAYFTLDQRFLESIQPIYPWAPDHRPEPAGAARNRFEQALFASTARSAAVPFLSFDQRSRGNPGVGAVEIARNEMVARGIPAPAGGRPPVAGPLPTAHTLQAQSYPTKSEDISNLRRQRLNLVLLGWGSLLALTLVAGYIGLWCFVNTSTLLRVHAGAALVVVPALLLGMCMLVTAGKWAMESAAPMAAMKGEAPRFRMMEKDKAIFGQPADATGGGGRMVPEAVLGAFNKEGAQPEKPGQPAQEGAPAPRVREEFPETLLWKPLLITNDKGELPPLEVPLADSITTWQLSASAVSKEGQLGAMQMGLKVFQSFFVELDLPVYLTRNDEVDIRCVVYNYDRQPQTVTLKLADGDWFERQGDGDLKVEVKPGEPQSARFRIKVKKAGSHDLQVSAHGKGAADALKKVIEVVPDGRRVEQLVSGSLLDDASVRMDVPMDAIEGSVRAFLKIYPTTFSQVVEGLDSIFRMPYGCFEQTSSTTYPNVLALDYLKKTGQSKPEVEAQARHYIHLGYQRLLTFEAPGGGFDWFGHGGGGVRLSAYGLLEFSDMAKVHPVDPNLLERTRNWLLSGRNQDGSWPAEGGRMHFRGAGNQDADLSRLASTAYAAWAVFGSGASSSEAKSTLDFLVFYQPRDLNDPYLLALVCNALLAIDPSGKEAEPYLKRLDSRKSLSEDGKLFWWELNPQGGRTIFYGAGVGGNVEATAMAALAMIQGKRNPDTVRGALAWLVKNKGPGGLWYSTQTSVLALKALLAGAGAPANDAKREIEIKLGDHKQTIAIPADQGDVMRQLDLTAHLKPGTNRLQVQETTETGASYQVAFRYHVPEQAKPESGSGDLGIDLTYDRTAVNVGEMVTATVRISNRMKQDAAMVMLELPVPPGFAPVSETFAALVGKPGGIARYQASSRQVLVYLRGLTADKPLEITYHLRATTPAKVSARGARVYEYYAPERQAVTPALAMTVK